ncbi:MAG: hypothetical protein ACOCVF_04360 [bacterium]
MIQTKNKKINIFLLSDTNNKKNILLLTDSKNNLLEDFRLSFFSLKKNFSLKHRGAKLNSYNNFALDFENSDFINNYVLSIISKVNNNNNNKIHTQNNYNALKNCTSKYPKGTNIFSSGLYSKLKTLFKINKLSNHKVKEIKEVIQR